VSAASIHMTRAATHWFQTYKPTPGYQNWEQFSLDVVSEFEVDTHRSKAMELLNLKQTGSVEEYRRAFEQLVYHIRLYDNSLSPTMLTAQFILGLKEELRFQVEMQLPEIVAKAVVLAAIQEKLLEKGMKRRGKFFSGKHNGSSS
jgi:hypothetical protein